MFSLTILYLTKQCTVNMDIDISCVHKNVVTIFKIISVIVKFLTNNFMHFETICNKQNLTLSMSFFLKKNTQLTVEFALKRAYLNAV